MTADRLEAASAAYVARFRKLPPQPVNVNDDALAELLERCVAEGRELGQAGGPDPFEHVPPGALA